MQERLNGVYWSVVACLFADDEFDRVCSRRKLKVNARKTKMMSFGKKESKVCD